MKRAGWTNPVGDGEVVVVVIMVRDISRMMMNEGMSRLEEEGPSMTSHDVMTNISHLRPNLE